MLGNDHSAIPCRTPPHTSEDRHKPSRAQYCRTGRKVNDSRLAAHDLRSSKWRHNKMGRRFGSTDREANWPPVPVHQDVRDQSLPWIGCNEREYRPVSPGRDCDGQHHDATARQPVGGGVSAQSVWDVSLPSAGLPSCNLPPNPGKTQWTPHTLPRHEALEIRGGFDTLWVQDDSYRL